MAYDAYTKLMLHFNGADASTTFTDEIGHTFTAYLGAQLDQAEKKFGNASGLFDGTDAYIDTPDHADFTLGSGEFTVDFWVKRNTSGVYEAFCGHSNALGTSYSFYIMFLDDDTVYVEVKTDVDVRWIQSTGTITDTNWHHIALVRDNTGTDTLRLFIDGGADGTASCNGEIVVDPAAKFAIGKDGEYDDYYFNGWIDEFRLSVGIARWTSGFTPPTSEYTEEAAAFIPFKSFYQNILAH